MQHVILCPSVQAHAGSAEGAPAGSAAESAGCNLQQPIWLAYATPSPRHQAFKLQTGSSGELWEVYSQATCGGTWAPFRVLNSVTQGAYKAYARWSHLEEDIHRVLPSHHAGSQPTPSITPSDIAGKGSPSPSHSCPRHVGAAHWRSKIALKTLQRLKPGIIPPANACLVGCSLSNCSSERAQ